MFKLLAALVTLAAMAMSPAHAQQRDLESAVKATFLVRFASFVQWPSDAFPNLDDPVVICVAGDAGLGDLVEAAARGERIGTRSIAVRRIADLSPTSRCHVLYAAGTSGQTVSRALEIVRGQPILTVTDQRRASTRGMIHFVVDGGRVRFHVDRGAIEESRLNASSRLLNVALSVQRRSRP